MACFDQIPSRTFISLQHLTYDGHTVFDLNNAVLSTVGINTIRGRQWLSLSFTFLDQLGAAGHTYAFWNRTIRSLFDNPAVTTKACIGFRMDLPTAGAALLSLSTTNSLFFIDGIPVDNNFLSSIPVGEHFIEFEIDLVNKVVRSVLNGVVVHERSVPTLTLDSIFRWGISSTFSPRSTGIAFHVTDVYLNYDNQDGTASGRLGPVKVYATPVDKIEVPVNWKGLDDATQTYNLKDGGTWDAAVIMPKGATESDQPGQFSFTTVPAMTSGTPAQCISPTTFRCYWSGGAATAIALNVVFTEPKKVSGYVIQGYSTLSAFDGWKFQASNDGTTWVDLDVRANGQAAWFMAQADRVGAFKLAPDKIGSYRYYRLAVSNSVATSARIEFYHFNLLSDPADIIENNVKAALNRPANYGFSDLDSPVLRPPIDESEGSVGFKIPTFGTADVLAVKVGIAARRDQGSSEHLIGKVKVGNDSTNPVDYELKPHTEDVKPLALLQKTPGGAAWTKESLESLRVVLKTKRGAN
jgi:hypothetical protein